MADLTITAANVLAGEPARIEQGISNATLAAGKVVYKDATTGKFGLADSNDASSNIRTPYGIALNGASAGQPVSILRSGKITIGATMTAGVAYYLSDTPGGICPVADVGSGEYAAFIGISTSTTVLDVGIKASGVSL